MKDPTSSPQTPGAKVLHETLNILERQPEGNSQQALILLCAACQAISEAIGGDF